MKQIPKERNVSRVAHPKKASVDLTDTTWREGMALVKWGFPGGSVVKKPPVNAGDGGSAGSGRSPGEGNGNPLQCSYLGNHMDRGAWQATVHRITKNQTQLSN